METDDDLLERSGVDPLAFEPLVERHAVAIHGYLNRRAPQAADDLLAEVWLAAFAGRRSFDRRVGVARGWLFGIARNVLLAHYRRRTTVDLEAAGLGAGQVVDDWAGVDSRLDAAAVKPQLREALAALPDVERELLLLVSWDQLSPSEAAQVVGIPAGTARSRLHRARAGMRERLAAGPQVPGIGLSSGFPTFPQVAKGF